MSAAYAAFPVGPEGLAEKSTPAADDIMAMVVMSVLFPSRGLHDPLLRPCQCCSPELQVAVCRLEEPSTSCRGSRDA